MIFPKIPEKPILKMDQGAIPHADEHFTHFREMNPWIRLFYPFPLRVDFVLDVVLD